MARLMRWALVMVALLVAMPAAAQSSKDKELAKAVLDRGAAHEKAGELDDALAAFRIAHDLLKDPFTGASLCRVLMKKGLLVEARSTCLAVIQMPSPSMEPSAHQKARDEAMDTAAELEGRVAQLEIVVVGLEGKAKPKVTLDGIEVRIGDGAQPADPGKRKIVVTAEGYDDGVAEITLKEGASEKVEVKMKRPGTADAADAEGGGGLHPLFWGGIAATGVGLIAGVITGVFVVSEKNRLNDECAQPNLCSTEFESDLQLATALAHVSTASFVLAGLGVGAIVGGWFLSSDDTEVGVWLHPSGLTLRGRF